MQLIQDLQRFLSPTCKPTCVTELRCKEAVPWERATAFWIFNNRLAVIPLLFVSPPEPKVRECVLESSSSASANCLIAWS